MFIVVIHVRFPERLGDVGFSVSSNERAFALPRDAARFQLQPIPILGVCGASVGTVILDFAQNIISMVMVTTQAYFNFIFSM